MNRERLRELAAVLENAPAELYRQTRYGRGGDPRDCGTPCCLLGWAAALWGRKLGVRATESDVRREGIRALGLRVEEGDEIARGWWPAAWFLEAGLGVRTQCEVSQRIEPNRDEAVAILRWIAARKAFPFLAVKEAGDPPRYFVLPEPVE